MRMRVLGAVAVVAALLMSSCGGDKQTEAVKVVRPVRVDTVTMTGGKRVRTFSGTARAGVESKLSFRIPGTLETVKVNLGDRVKKGDVIAQLDPKDYELQVQEAEAGLTQAIAQARNARANYERVRGLYENNNISVTELDAARTQRESADAQVDSIRKRLELARLQSTYTILYAPISGSIAQLMAEENENVGAGTPIAVLNAGTHPEVTFAVPEQLITFVAVGDEAKVHFDAIGKELSAVVTEVGVATTQLATTYPVVLRLRGNDENIRPGMAADVTMVLGDAKNQARLLVKPIAVVEDQNDRFVYVAKPGNGELAVVERRVVQTGDLTEDGLEIVSGLSEGEMLITAGMRFLKEGMEVRIPAGEGE